MELWKAEFLRWTRVQKVWTYLVNARRRADTRNSVNFEFALNHSNTSRLFRLFLSLSLSLSFSFCFSFLFLSRQIGCNRNSGFSRDTDTNEHHCELRLWIGQKHSGKLKNMAGVQCPARWHKTVLVISFLLFVEVQPCGTIGWIIPGEKYPGHFHAYILSRRNGTPSVLNHGLAICPFISFFVFFFRQFLWV